MICVCAGILFYLLSDKLNPEDDITNPSCRSLREDGKYACLLIKSNNNNLCFRCTPDCIN